MIKTSYWPSYWPASFTATTWYQIVNWVYCTVYSVHTVEYGFGLRTQYTHTQCPANPESYVLLMTTGDNYMAIFIWIHNDNIGSLLREMPAQTKLNSDLVLSGFNLFTGIQRPKPKPCSIANMLKSSSPHPETLAEGRSKIRDAKTHQVMSPDITTNKPTFINSPLLS